uniref:Tetraspanin n=1 Tax=Panagrellus redivivus TaxID=6233 RepID=A0A7E4UTH4_PANRE
MNKLIYLFSAQVRVYLQIALIFTGVVFAIIAVILIIALPKDLFRKADVNVVRNRLLETTNDTRFDDIWITVQNKFECCGVDRGIDWVGSSRFETEPDNAPTCCRNTDECADIKTVEQFDRCCPTAGCLPHILKSFYEYQELWHTRMFTFYHYMILLLGVVLANAILPKRYWYDCDQVARLPNPNQDDEIPLLDLSAHENDQPDAADDATSQQL